MPSKDKEKIRQYHLMYKEKNREKCKQYNKYWLKMTQERLRKAVIAFLGGRCQRCGFSDERALQLDHVHGGGNKEVKSKGRIWVYNNVFKCPENYQLLCANCNWIKRAENKEGVTYSG